MSKKQMGFTLHRNTQINIEQLNDWIKKLPNGFCLIFIDLKLAYNSIKRDILYYILKKE